MNEFKLQQSFNHTRLLHPHPTSARIAAPLAKRLRKSVLILFLWLQRIPLRDLVRGPPLFVRKYGRSTHRKVVLALTMLITNVSDVDVESAGRSSSRDVIEDVFVSGLHYCVDCFQKLMEHHAFILGAIKIAGRLCLDDGEEDDADDGRCGPLDGDETRKDDSGKHDGLDCCRGGERIEQKLNGRDGFFPVLLPTNKGR